MDSELQKVLDARQQRWEIRRMLTEKHHRPLITITLCVPAAYRVSEEFWELFLKLCRDFWKVLISSGQEAYFEGYIRNEDGPAVFISACGDALEIKRICAEAEDTIIGGRMLDIDVMDKDGTPIGRSDIGLPPRQCFVCDKPAAVCVSRKLHSPDEISACVEQLKEQVKK